MESRETVKSPDSRWTRDLFIATTAPTTTPGATHKTGSQPARGFITKKKGDDKKNFNKSVQTDSKYVIVIITTKRGHPDRREKRGKT